ncbi:MAG TPA: hypothetical protein VFN40_00775, partial [Gemmatimonadales bacterium]|nr:hypothetical protein [Gemmatimonadales bacterium]
MSHRAWSWVMVIVAAGAAAAEWLRRPAWVWVAAVVILLAVLVVLGRPGTGWRRGALLATLAGLAAALAVSQWRLTAIETHWPEQRKRRIDAASERLAGDLHAAYHRAERLTEAAAAASATDDRETAFTLLERLVPTGGPEMSIVILDAAGLPWAWAGRHRLAPAARGDSIGSRATGYYVELEARRHTPEGRVAVAGVLIWA